MNNYYTKKLLLYFYQNAIFDKTDYELCFLRKKILILLNDNNQTLLEFHINNCFESYIKIRNLNCELEKFFINKELGNITNTDIRQINNNIDFYINNPINNNMIQNNYNCLNDINFIGNKIENNYENNNFSLELEDTINVKSDKIVNKEKKPFKQKKKIFKVITKVSRYIGVSKNKKKWQSYIRINNKNLYLGTYQSEKVAATIYDIMSIKKKGINARTNFKYSQRQLQKIMELDFDINDIFKIAKKYN